MDFEIQGHARIIATLTAGIVPFIKSVIGAPITIYFTKLIRSKRGPMEFATVAGGAD